MISVMTTPRPRGWYQKDGDPPAVQRWWDGTKWTSRTTGGAASDTKGLEPGGEQPRTTISSSDPIVRQAIEARHRGDRFFQVHINVGTVDGRSSWGSSESDVYWRPQTTLLAAIEDRGWELFDIGYVYVLTGSTSSDRKLHTGEGTAQRGNVTGIYLFRRTNS